MRNFEIKLKLDKWPSFVLQFDRDYGIDRRTGWSCAIDGSFYAELVSNPLAAVWRAIAKHKAAVRDMAADEKYMNAGGAGEYWDKAEYSRKQIQKYTGDWREAFKQFRETGSAGSVHVDCFIRDFDEAVANAIDLRDAAHGK